MSEEQRWETVAEVWVCECGMRLVIDENGYRARMPGLETGARLTNGKFFRIAQPESLTFAWHHEHENGVRVKMEVEGAKMMEVINAN